MLSDSRNFGHRSSEFNFWGMGLVLAGRDELFRRAIFTEMRQGTPHGLVKHLECFFLNEPISIDDNIC
jgi:hypothetical protein